ncbi:MAG TPA: aquaporin [Gemmatimonadaceae bacterium]|jgi:Glycerol uptake facilitator and related permeases (Major Intrinsic Protein Family)
MRKYITEFIGTFFLVLTVVLSVHYNAMPGLAIGAMLMVMVYMGGAISGGHYNPGVSLGVALRGKLSYGEMIAYWIAQSAGAVGAVLIGWLLVGRTDVVGVKAFTGEVVVQALVAEFVFSFALVLTVLTTATSAKTAGNSYFGLAIGFTVGAGVLAVGALTGAAFNSAVGLGVCFFGLSAMSNLWIYIVANLLGGAVAAAAFRVMSPEDHEAVVAGA